VLIERAFYAAISGARFSTQTRTPKISDTQVASAAAFDRTAGLR
jgi:hypothetical protein